MKSTNQILDMPRIAILHPDLGIGGAERLIIDIGLALKYSGHDVDIYTNFHDKTRCFDETRNGQLNVFVACSWFPRNLFGRFNALCAYIRFILLAIYVVYIKSKEKPYDIYLCDQISACIPVLRSSGKPVLFYCHYPDHLLTKRESLAKKLYRWPIDRFEVRALLFFLNMRKTCVTYSTNKMSRSIDRVLKSLVIFRFIQLVLLIVFLLIVPIRNQFLKNIFHQLFQLRFSIQLFRIKHFQVHYRMRMKRQLIFYRSIVLNEKKIYLLLFIHLHIFVNY
jgi:hypothetical protein